MVVIDVVAWGAALAACASFITVIKFWTDIGRTQQRIEDMAEAVRLSTARYELLASVLNEFKIESARTYATVKELNDTESQLGAAMERAVQGIFTRLEAITQRLDSLMVLARNNNGSHS